jgi:transcriptional regulator with XRE-family HTH domain
MRAADVSRRELARFLRSRRERLTPADVGFPTGPRRRSQGLRREEVAVLAGLSPTWYTYLEQGRDISPSPEVMNSLARVLGLTEDERRYIHTLTFGQVISPEPLNADLSAEDLLRQFVSTTDDSPYPAYAANHYADLIAWNRAAAEWYDDWSAYPLGERNIIRWMLTAPQAKVRLLNWESDTRDAIARWRGEAAKWPGDEGLRRRVREIAQLSPQFEAWWDEHYVQEHRSRIRRFRHPRLGVQALRIVPVVSPEFAPSGVVFHLPVGA